MINAGDKFTVYISFTTIDGAKLYPGLTFINKYYDIIDDVCHVTVSPGQQTTSFATKISGYDIKTFCVSLSAPVHMNIGSAPSTGCIPPQTPQKPQGLDSGAVLSPGLAAWLPTPEETENFWAARNYKHHHSAVIKFIKCECGSEIAGSSRHSSWCPKHDSH